MDKDKILEIARRHLKLTWVNDSPEDLIAFAQAAIEAEREQTAIKVPTVVWDKLKDVNTVTDLIKALQVAEKAE